MYDFNFRAVVNEMSLRELGAMEIMLFFFLKGLIQYSKVS
jgi:hypothetical protein